MTGPDRREFLIRCSATLVATQFPDILALGGASNQERFTTRGVVLVPEDLTLADWPRRAKEAGLTTIALHHQNSPQAVIRCVESDAGRRFIDQCRTLGLNIEFELHAMKELLPRNLFSAGPEMFRMNDAGERTPDANCCVHSSAALQTIGENALRIAKSLRPTTSRYFFWGDDGQPWCRCPECRELSPSEQALIIENHLCQALRALDPRAQVAHLAYTNTIAPPQKIKPDAGVFLEFAPINRRYDIAYERQQNPNLTDGLSALDANLRVFPPQTAQVLEYWLDVSRFSHWKRPGVQLPWNNDVFRADVETYAKRAIRHVTSFAAWIDGDYRARYGDLSFIRQYGEGLRHSESQHDARLPEQ
jgi:hypothetical protein